MQEAEIQAEAPRVDEEWNRFLLSHPGGHLLQSYQWAQFKSRYGWTPSRVLVRDAGHIVAGCQVLFRDLRLASVAYVPKGPVVDFDDDSLVQILLEGMHSLCRRRRAAFLRIEPDLPDDSDVAERLMALGFHPGSKVQPRSTLVLDIQREETDILAGMKSKTRYNIGLAERKNVKVREGTEEDVSTFYRMSAVTSLRNDFPIHEEGYYLHAYRTFVPSGLARLFIAEYEGEPLAGLMAFTFGPIAWYMYGASSNRHRNRMPNHLLQWHAIRWAKAKGCTEYDFWGIPDEIGQDSSAAAQASERSDGLWGVYRFKEGFGGRIVRYLGAYDYVYSPLLHLLGTRAWPWARTLLYRLRRRPMPGTDVDIG